MINLFLDTTNKNIIISIVKDDTILAQVNEVSDNNVSETLFTLVDKVFSNANLAIAQVEKIYVAVGPGSFTGTRVGVTFAKTLAWSLKVPVVPLSSLEIIASTNSGSDYVIPYIDARHNHIYVGIYQNNLTVYLADQHILKDSFWNKIPDVESIVFVGYDELNTDYQVIKPAIDVLKIINKHKTNPGLPPHELKPNYLKKSSAEEKLSD